LTFKNILKNYKVDLEKFDFLKIDIEGEDYKVLKNINLKKYNPELICIEDGIEKKENKQTYFYPHLNVQIKTQTERDSSNSKIENVKLINPHKRQDFHSSEFKRYLLPYKSLLNFEILHTRFDEKRN
jgi:hypothetical protein